LLIPENANPFCRQSHPLEEPRRVVLPLLCNQIDADPTRSHSNSATTTIGLNFLRSFSMRIPTLGLLCIGILGSLATDARANLVINGGFESPVIGAAAFTTFNVGSTAITGWTVISGTTDPGAGSVDLLSTFQTPHSGSQSIDLDGSPPGPTPGGISQLLTGLIPNTTYTLDFFYSNNPNGTSSSALVTVGSLSTTITHSGAGFGTPNYTEATFTFTASATTQLLSFVSTDSATDVNGIILDDVSVNVATVSEPATLGSAVVGVLMMLGFARRRSRKKSVMATLSYRGTWRP
jgi:choice-of-anchor C domain-containing protein